MFLFYYVVSVARPSAKGRRYARGSCCCVSVLRLPFMYELPTGIAKDTPVLFWRCGYSGHTADEVNSRMTGNIRRGSRK